MKKSIAIVAVIVLSFMMAYAEQGVVFSVSPGMTIQSSSFGYKFGRFIPAIGLDMAFMTVSGEYTTSDWGYDWYTGNYYKWSSSSNEYSGSAVLFMPHISMRYLFVEKAISPYITVSVTKCFSSVNGTSSSSYTYYNPDGSIVSVGSSAGELDEKLKKQIQNVLGFWYYTAGFGAEYHVSPSFSIIGESGLRLALSSSEEEGNGTPISSGTSSTAYTDEWKLKMAAVVGLTYTKVGLCYNF